MMLGKRGRARHAMRRTTSMTEFAPPEVLESVVEEDCVFQETDAEATYWWAHGGAGQDWLAAYRSRVGLRRSSADYSAAETAAFLRACGLCRRRLGPGRDTFMYKGETAFCSLECRQQHMTQEEWKEKCAVTSMKEVAPASAGGSEKSSTGGTVAAA